ncbi:DUF6665 family protein [Devosia sp. CN2-171]|jgi:hypothetical protein|uniref:DUF6665 family protein n=1 Tax=Devosia sp. CN2-171 TaxID=3400909 RepID=UPI003BF78F40
MPSFVAMPLTALDIAELRQRLTSGFGSIETEVMGEKASSLGHYGRQVEAAMAALNAHGGSADERLILVKGAARAVWKYFVQREACGMRDHREAIRLYGIPGEVLVRLGAIEP